MFATRGSARYRTAVTLANDLGSHVLEEFAEGRERATNDEEIGFDAANKESH